MLLHKLLFTFIFSCSLLLVQAQCISSFPYQEDFEANNGNWTTGGTAPDWAWGTPNKRVINAAASGTKCWITGGLTVSHYNNNERSWLQSPCFNFTNLLHPYIKFNAFWETEKRYDGAALQYSIDGGVTWTLLGAYADSLNCPSSNWFNTQNITALGSDGWTGNIQTSSSCNGGAGGGRGRWVLAQHAMDNLAGKPQVRFRFTFGAGSVCNDYDGFAVDDIWIGEAPPVGAPSFTYACGTARTVSFAANVNGCATYAWDFGDAASTNNTSSLSNPSHIFSAAGQYIVTLTATINGVVQAPVQKTISIIDVALTEQTSIDCFGDKNGSIAALVSPAGNYNYQWNTTPVQNTPIASGLGAGSYTVQVSGNNVCSTSAGITLAQPQKLQHQKSFTNAICSSANGSAIVLETGGVTPYSYSWSPNGGNSATAQNLQAGNYSVSVTDNNGCTDTAHFVLQSINPLHISLGADTLICTGEQLILYPGHFAQYKWQDLSTDTALLVNKTGTYFVNVTDANGCEARAQINVTVNCSDIHFPSAFTPNGDGLNDDFGAIGNVVAVNNYTLRVFNRWGNIVFTTSNPFQKWDGRLNGKAIDTNSFVWLATYTIRGKQMNQKGTVTLIQ